MIRTCILLLVVAVLLLKALRSLRAQRLKERYVLLFLLTGLPFAAFAAWPDGIVLASEWLEIEKPTLLVLAVTIYFILITFSLLSMVSVQDRKITTLAQTVAILQAEQSQQKTDGKTSDEASRGEATRSAHLPEQKHA